MQACFAVYTCCPDSRNKRWPNARLCFGQKQQRHVSEHSPSSGRPTIYLTCNFVVDITMASLGISSFKTDHSSFKDILEQHGATAIPHAASIRAQGGVNRTRPVSRRGRGRMGALAANNISRPPLLPKTTTFSTRTSRLPRRLPMDLGVCRTGPPASWLALRLCVVIHHLDAVPEVRIRSTRVLRLWTASQR